MRNFRVVCVSFIAVLAASCGQRDDYFVCKGSFGISHGQSMISLIDRTITGDPDAVSGSLHIAKDEVSIDGISQFVDSHYKVCSEHDETVWFSPAGQKDCDRGDEFDDLGVFNKITGVLRYHVGDDLAVLKCKKANKLED